MTKSVKYLAMLVVPGLVIAIASLGAPALLRAASYVLTLPTGDRLTVECGTDLKVQQPDSRRAVLECAAAAAPTPTPAAMPAPAATATPVPASAPTATATTAPSGIPDCPHDPTRWHALVERNADGSIRCTYGHEHKDDPRVLDRIFGPLQYGEISYPWQTHSHLGSENDAKHRFYAWNVVENADCKPFSFPYGFRNIRLQAHQDGNAGATVRFHSYFLQAEGCDPNDPAWRGRITIGGHMDFGSLMLWTRKAPEPPCEAALFAEHWYCPLPNDAGNQVQRIRIHGSPWLQRGDFTWYGHNNSAEFRRELPVFVAVGIRAEDWGPIDPADPARLLFYGSELNGSWQEPAHIVAVQLGWWLDTLDGKQDGYVTYHGFTDRYGNIVPTCSPVGPDCVPLHLENMKIGNYQFRADVYGLAVREYDVKGPDGKSLMRYPN